MGIECKAQFKMDKTKCIKCGRCVNTCSGMVIKFGNHGYPELIPFERFGWRGWGMLCIFHEYGFKLMNGSINFSLQEKKGRQFLSL